jgi:small subunit ribosomal protein S16
LHLGAKFNIYSWLKYNQRREGHNMATVIRLTRMGRKKQPFYRIAVTDSRKRRDGGWIELIGHYNPMVAEKTMVVDVERLDYWLSVGATMSDRVKKITGR